MSYIFSTSIYAIYEVNSLGDTSLDGYIAESSSGNDLKNLYDAIYETCLSQNECKLELIKTPVSKDNQFIYNIYHSQLENIDKPASISPDTTFNYKNLTKEDFVDNNGVFYTDISPVTLDNISKQTGNRIEAYNSGIPYSQILQYNAFNFVIFLIISLLVLFIYTFTRIKINAIKKVMGFSKLKMIADSMKNFLLLEVIILLITLSIHFVYYLNIGRVVPRYFVLIILFMGFIILLNMLMLLFTQISLKFININLMIKNKVYSNTLNYALYIIKILLMLIITVSISFSISKYEEYKEKRDKLKH
ncbi:hypothetical protein MUN88_06845 [Gracilibacillus caseinilyticus]|uniref:FtsX-like permease family protein n=1 Tax=Gracilibacillus caseinilyticus TaxID=2932256 RepID=A0ABY4EZS8_9BACI|nr:hypothetical protein [Gracilibacillus caseinilyticus]UOQ49785.1 hypothetical protein MUN88_06845 [Gracilibacillus caseinilyticus]